MPDRGELCGGEVCLNRALVGETSCGKWLDSQPAFIHADRSEVGESKQEWAKAQDRFILTRESFS